jgi:amidophosphoribosyltransferase
VDDSIVRGTTSRKIIELVRQAGARRVDFVSTCPPIQHPCYYGIDFPSREELIGSGRTLSEIESELGADRVVYQDSESLKSAIQESGLKTKDCGLCTACLDGKYPTDISQAAASFEKKRRDERMAMHIEKSRDERKGSKE